MSFFKGGFLIFWGFSFCLPLTLKLFPPEDRSFIQVASATFGVSIGFLTLLMAYLATFLKPLFNLYGIVISISILFIFLSLLWLRKWNTIKLAENGHSSFLENVLKGSILFICLLVFWESIYYPFVTQDAITHYAIPARDFFLRGGMDGFHIPHLRGTLDAYPLLVTLSYVYTFFAMGGISEHAAKVIPAIFSIGLIGSTYLFGKHLFDKRIGYFSALILSFSPFFLKWATSGYTDIPCAFFYTNSVLYCWLTYRHRSLPYAILTGLMVGFSIWTKNAALLIFISILLFFSIQKIFSKGWRREGGGISFHHLVIILSVSLIIGGPWYLRNYLLYQHLVPSEWVPKGFWIDYGVPPMKYFGSLGYHFSILYCFGLLYGFTRLFKTDTRTLFLLSFIFPYLVVWLLKFSYDSRFLLEILPLFVVLGVWSFAEFFKKEFNTLARRKTVVWLTCVLFILPHLGYRISKDRDLFSRPLMSDDEKRLKKMKRFYPIVLYLKDIQSKKTDNIRIISGERRLVYFFNDDIVSHRFPTKMEELKNFDYFVYTPYTLDHYRGMGALDGNEILTNLMDKEYFLKAFESGGNIVYKIIH